MAEMLTFSSLLVGTKLAKRQQLHSYWFLISFSSLFIGKNYQS